MKKSKVCDVVYVQESRDKETKEWEPCLAFRTRSEARANVKHDREYYKQEPSYEDYDDTRVARYVRSGR